MVAVMITDEDRRKLLELATDIVRESTSPSVDDARFNLEVEMGSTSHDRIGERQTYAIEALIDAKIREVVDRMKAEAAK
jgi:hypothetical protein